MSNHEKTVNFESDADDEEESRAAASRSQPPPPTGGFRNVVRKLQLAAKLSSVAQEESLDEFQEDVKLSRTSNVRATLRRRSRYQKSKFVSMVNRPRSSTKASSITSFSNVIRPSTSYQSVHIQPAYSYGEIRFFKEDPKQNVKPYIAIEPSRIRQDDVDHILSAAWQLEMPKIVTLIVSGKSHKHQWANKKQIKNFQTGIAKAALSTNMWLITNGLNGGVTSYICSAIEGELRRLKQKQLDKLENLPLVIGICHDLDLTYGQRLGSLEIANSIVWVENIGYSEENKFELDPFHSHYVIMRANSGTGKTALEEREATPQSMAMAKLDFVTMLLRNESFVKDNDSRQKHSPPQASNEPAAQQVPLVSILIEGGPEETFQVLNLIKSGIPVVVLKGSGGLADIIAFAYTRIWTTISDVGSWDADYIEDYIKPLLVQKICVRLTSVKDKLLRRNIVCDQVIECVRLSKQDRREYINILDMYDRNAHQLTNLSELLLKALLSSSRNQDTTTQEQVLKDFDLIIDWNCASVAKNLLFAQNSSNFSELFKPKFFASLTRPNREEFVDIFLMHGFQVHKFLSPSQLARLYRYIHDDDFFHSVCWETALGHSGTARQNKFFIENDLNWLIEYCTGLEAYVSSEELHINSQGLGNFLSPGRKALILLSFWAVMQNRYKLVEVLWKHSDHPVHHALVISMLFERLSWHVLDTNLKAELKERSKLFADYANGVLDQCYIDNITQAYNVLKESIKDWNYKTAVDIAANAQLKQFLAHPCCQKWLTNTYYGHIRLRKLAWGVFTIPNMLKILLCSILVLPMFIWIRFKDNDEDEHSAEEGGGDSEEELDVYESIYNGTSGDAKLPDHYIMESSFITTPSSPSIKMPGIDNQAFEMTNEITRRSRRFEGSSHRQPELFVKKQPPLWSMICMMWGSPITKFYTSQLFYCMYLIILSISTLYPDRGNFIIDSIVCVWTFLITISSIRHTYVIFLKYSSISLYYRICEIVLIGTFTVLLVLTRILHLHLYSSYAQKIINSSVLLYFYYRFIVIYLPISSTLGPLLYRFSLMITVDFVNYLRIASFIIIGNVIVMNTLEFPWKELNMDTYSKVFHDSVLTLFYGPPKEITVYAHDPSLNITLVDGKSNETLVEPETYSSLPIYMFLYQYFIILKLIIGALLFAIFSVTASKWIHEVDNIWKFQRYLVIIDFANRLPLPEPLSLFYYLYWMCKYLGRGFLWCFYSKAKQQQSKFDSCYSHNTISPEDCIYWRELATEYLQAQQRHMEEETMLQRSWEYTQEIAEELEYEKRVLREIKSKLFELEKNIQSNVVGTDTNEQTSGGGGHLSRSSPYPGTKVIRFPVPRKYISWNVNYFAYEPVSYSRDIDDYPLEVQPFIDEDILAQREEKLRNLNSPLVPSSVTSKRSPFPRSLSSLTLQMPPKWNSIELSSNGILTDRRLWHDQETFAGQQNMAGEPSQQGEYRLEDDFLPVNPSGRTGLRGRGALQRWAVNHYCFVIITQMEKGRITRILCEQSPEQGRLQLIERFVNNKEEMYQQVFTSLFPDPTQPTVIRNWNNLYERIEKIFEGEWWFDVQHVRTGYLDDPMNTDNAWKEGNVYLIRFGTNNSITGGDKGRRGSTALVPRCLRDNDQRSWCPLTEEFIDNLPQVHSNLIALVNEKSS